MRIIPVTRRGALAAGTGLALALGALAGCGSGSGSGGSGGVKVVASFYPMEYVATRVVGSYGTVSSLTRPGVEPHDLELTPREVASVADAELVFYVKGFQPAVDAAVAQEAAGRADDASAAARLTLRYTPIEGGRALGGQAGSLDPHFWLDPQRLAAVGDALAQRLGRLDPTHQPQYAANAAALHHDLDALDAQFRQGLSRCADNTVVTSHNAFGYLAERYGLQQVGITGLSPETEPSPTQLADVATFVRQHHVTTIYYETLVSPKIADTVARETGVTTAVLDPIEGLTDASAGRDYVQVMQANLGSLRAGLHCS